MQQARLRKLFPAASCRILRSKLTWEGWLAPSGLGQQYRVRLAYSLQDPPRVYLIEPGMRKVGGKLPEHIYTDDGRLCLYLPSAGDWDGTMSLADTMVPWACEWLFHYEIWLATGVWCGGGSHPTKARPYAKRDGQAASGPRRQSTPAEYQRTQ